MKIDKNTEAYIEQSAKMIEEGRLDEMGFGKVHQGRPPLTYEELQMVSVKLPVSVLNKIDSQANNRSEFIREAIYKALA